MPKRDVSYTEITCDRCGRKIQVEKEDQFRYYLRITKYAVLWWGKLWTPRGWNVDFYLCEDCLSDLEIWIKRGKENNRRSKR